MDGKKVRLKYMQVQYIKKMTLAAAYLSYVVILLIIFEFVTAVHMTFEMFL